MTTPTPVKGQRVPMVDASDLEGRTRPATTDTSGVRDPERQRQRLVEQLAVPHAWGGEYRHWLAIRAHS
ncbi:MAG: hypothetical protein ACC726_08140 [Chloroflexota bacterium]